MAESDSYSASDSDQPNNTSSKGGPSTSRPPPSKKAKGQKKDKDTGGDADTKRRSSKACDNCRKSKCKCTRVLDPATSEPVGPCQNCVQVGADCTFLGASRKRGPPKGYIEAIESRLHRMEALLGNLLASDDPRSQTLLGELIGDSEARDVLARDLKTAAETSSAGKTPKRSWKREFEQAQEHAEKQQQQQQLQQQQQQQQQQANQLPQPPVISTGFGGSTSNVAPDGRVHAAAPMWLTEDDLSGVGFMQTDPSGANALGFDPSSFGNAASPVTFGSSSGDSPNINFSNSIPVHGAPLQAHPRHLSTSSASTSNSSAFPAPTLDLSTSPRQKRRIDLPSPSSSYNGGNSGGGLTSLNAAGSPNAGFPASFGPGPSTTSPGGGSATTLDPAERKQMAYAFTLPSQGTVPPRNAAHATTPLLAPGTIGHTGSARYNMSSSSGSGAGGLTAAGGGGGGKEKSGKGAEEPMNELADVVGQLSLNENAEVRYHGRSSGLYLIASSQRFRDFFWRFAVPEQLQPQNDGRVHKSEQDVLRLAGLIAPNDDPLPSKALQAQLLTAYWAYVHPHYPVLEKITFLRQYRYSLAHPDSNEQSTPAGTGKVPTVLLLSMFALAARYCDFEEVKKEGKPWSNGQEYLERARALLNYDYGSSRLVTVQSLLLISYREIGVGAMSSAWMTTGMAIRMAQDLGLFRDVEKWYLPVPNRFGHEEKQTRKRIWWGCVILDRYISSYIGRPGTIHERDYDCGFPSENEPDEHEQWRPIRVDGTEWHEEPKNPSNLPPPEVVEHLKSYPPTRAHTLSCFNAAGSLAVIVNRIISNIYAIRIRVLGQSSETLLSLLDQSLASWYLALPPHLQYNPTSAKVPPPHILSLHLQFYSSLILLHRPFIPGQNSTASLGNFPSHSICTTSANAIANIVTTWRKTFTLRQCPPFLTYPIFSASIMHVYNASFDEALARPAKLHLLQCLDALKDMQDAWGSAARATDLLHGLVDLRDADLNPELARLGQERGTKRAAMDVDDPPASSFVDIRPANFHNRPPPVARAQSKSAVNRRRSTSASSGPRGASASRTPSNLRGSGSPSVANQPQLFPAPSPMNSSAPFQSPQFSFPTPPNAPVMPSSSTAAPGLINASSFDILNPSNDFSQFMRPPGATGDSTTDFADLLHSFLSPTEAAGQAALASPLGEIGLPSAGPDAPLGAGGLPPSFDPSITSQASTFDPTTAFFGMPMGVGGGDEWFNYSFNAFATPQEQGVGSTPSATQGATSPNNTLPL